MDSRPNRVSTGALRCAQAAALVLIALIAVTASAKADIIFQNQQSGQLVNWKMQGTTLRSYSFLRDPGSINLRLIGAADFNNDNRPDLLFQNQQTGELTYWLMNGTTFIRSGAVTPSLPGPLYWKVVAFTDLTGDGMPDILFQNQQNGQLVYWRMSGTNLVEYRYLKDPGTANQKLVATLDLNGDNSTDLLFQNQQTGELTYWLMNGTTFVSSGSLTAPGSPDWRVVGSFDFNSDQKPDLLFQNQRTGQLVYWLMNGVNLAGIGYINPDDPGSLAWRATTLWSVPDYVIQ